MRKKPYDFILYAMYNNEKESMSSSVELTALWIFIRGRVAKAYIYNRVTHILEASSLSLSYSSLSFSSIPFTLSIPILFYNFSVSHLFKTH